MAKQPYPYRFNFLIAGCFIAAVAVVVGLSFRLAVSPGIDTRKVVEHVELETMADFQKKLGTATTTGTGAQVAPQLSEVCPTIDVYEKSDGYVLLCRQ